MPTTTKPRFSVHPLAVSERPSKLYSYYVTGRGSFPFDMLRYDACWPASSDDASNMDSHYERGNTRSIRMFSNREPTIARWASFLWAVGTEKL